MSNSELNPPSYKESLPSGHSLQHQVTTVRSQHIKYIVLSQILPILSQRASKGLSKTTVALIPHNNIVPNENQPSTLLGLSDPNEPFSEVTLSSPIDTQEFWEQTQVLTTLHALLTAELSTNSTLAPPLLADEDSTIALPPRPSSSRYSFWSRKSSSASSILKVSSPKRPVSPNVKISVGTEEVCFRVVSDMGLYETMSQTAIIVRVVTK